ncbi:MAG TPA: ABC transporter permease subunit [Verrucomicrobiae bacterium]
MELVDKTKRFLYWQSTGYGLIPWVSRKIFGPQITAVAGVTLRATYRFRLFPALLLFLFLTVLVLPMVIKDDGTARGLTQILLTYTLGLSVSLLGFSTLWLACGVLARDIEDCTIQTLAVKPIARWEIWLGKWLGIMALNASLLSFVGFCVYGSVMYRAAKLPDEQKDVLRNQILVGRGSVKAPVPDMKQDVEALLQERLKEPTVAAMDRAFVRQQVEEMVKGREQYVPPLMGKRWELDFGAMKGFVQDREMQVRLKFNKGTLTQITSFPVMLQVGPPEDPRMIRVETALADESYHEIPVGKDRLDANGKLNVEFYNMSPVPLMVPLEDGIEVLYEESGFGVNFFRGMFIILLWLALLTALGLAAASYLSFPVAAFVSLAMLVVALSSGVMENVVREGTVTGVNHETGKAAGSLVDLVIVPMFRVLLKGINLIKEFSPIDSLSSGRSVTWWDLLRAIGQIGVLVTGLVSLVGIGLFYRRELAAVQQTS